jgi:hypothetical protein
VLSVIIRLIVGAHGEMNGDRCQTYFVGRLLLNLPQSVIIIAIITVIVDDNASYRSRKNEQLRTQMWKKESGVLYMIVRTKMTCFN